MSAGRPHVRRATEEDLEEINRIYNHYVLTSHVTFDVTPADMQWRRRWFDEHRNGRYQVFVAVQDGVVGFASSGRYRERPAYQTTVETSVYVAPGHAGRAIGSSLYVALFETLQKQDVHRAVAGIAQPNPASVALHRRFGFQRVGRFSEHGRKFDRYWDVDWYERTFHPLEPSAESSP
jgi:phosphinothricin acetyltransferase